MKVNWFFVSLIYRFQINGQGKLRPRQRCLAFENWHLIKAERRSIAELKAKKIAKKLCALPMTDLDTGKEGSWVLVGIKDIWPIHDELGDGAEIGWCKHINTTMESLRRIIVTGYRPN